MSRGSSLSFPKKTYLDPPIAENSTCLTQESISRIVPDCCMLNGESEEEEGFKRCRKCSRRAVAWSIFLPCGYEILSFSQSASFRHANCQKCSATIAKSSECNYCRQKIETVTNILFRWYSNSKLDSFFLQFSPYCLLRSFLVTAITPFLAQYFYFLYLTNVKFAI